MTAFPEHFASADFWRVPDRLQAQVPERLLHPAVAGDHVQGAASFSAERKHPVHLVDLPSRTMSMTLGGLEPAQTTSRHRHNYETLIYIIEGRGLTLIEDREVEWCAGDALYVPVWAWHQHRNRSDSERCLYLACENAPLLQNLGGLALREEAG